MRLWKSPRAADNDKDGRGGITSWCLVLRWLFVCEYVFVSVYVCKFGVSDLRSTADGCCWRRTTTSRMDFHRIRAASAIAPAATSRDGLDRSIDVQHIFPHTNVRSFQSQCLSQSYHFQLLNANSVGGYSERIYVAYISLRRKTPNKRRISAQSAKNLRRRSWRRRLGYREIGNRWGLMYGNA